MFDILFKTTRRFNIIQSENKGFPSFITNRKLGEMSCTQKLQGIFNESNMLRNSIRYKLNRTLYDYVSFMQSKIRKQLNTFTLLSICGGQRTTYSINPYFQTAYMTLTLEQKVLHFKKTIDFIKRFQQEKENSLVTTQAAQLQRIRIKFGQDVSLAIRINGGFNSWDQFLINIIGWKITSLKSINLDLRNYFLRKSKKKDVNCYVLQAIKSSKPRTIRFCFIQADQQNKYLPLINQLIDAAYYDFIVKESFTSQIGIMKKNVQTGSTKISLQQPLKLKNKQNNKNIKADQMLQIQSKINIKTNHQLSFQLMRSKDQQQIFQDLKQRIQHQNEIQNQIQSRLYVENQKKFTIKKQDYKNIYNIMLPNYNLNFIENLNNFQTLFSAFNVIIYKYKRNNNRFKMQLDVLINPQVTLKILYNVQLYKCWHPQVIECQQKYRISSQNCSIFYQKHASFSKWYKQRDYLYLKHVFQLNQDFYLVDKSFQNTNFVPFSSIQRGSFNHFLTKISKTQKGSKITMDIELTHGGLLNQSHCQQLTINYLKGFTKFEQYFRQQKAIQKLSIHFYHYWDVTTTLQVAQLKVNNSDLQSVDFQKISHIDQSDIDQSSIYFSVDDLPQQDMKQQISSQHQINQQQLLQKTQHLSWNKPSTILLDQNGRIIVPHDYTNKPHIVEPLKVKDQKRIDRQFQNVILQDNWRHLEDGGMEIINQKKIQAQNQVFSFILKKLRQNIFSGQGLSNISLPVQVFNCDSNLSRLCKGFALAPQYLQKASKLNNPVQRLKFSMIFGLTCSLFYLDAQKPFNPILGQTYQGIISGCPVYAQQTSHHPPISSFLMIGRGYKIYGSILAKVNLHVNSADGLNQGFYYIQFEDGQVIGFTTPPGEVSNTTMGGNRKFNFLGKGYYFDLQNRLYSQLIFQQNSGLFSKGKWKFRDQIEGQILKVNESFIKNVKKRIQQKKSPSDKQIQQKLNKCTGRWFFQMLWDDEVVYRPNEDLPFQANNYQYPLPSDCFYRQDIYYRIKQDLARSQIQKQRLEVFQRGDRKFREKYHKSSH